MSDIAALQSNLEIFPNPAPQNQYVIHISIPEFTCLCPKTGQPDFARLELAYVPDKNCLELKALKLYIHAYRDVGAFHEAITNQILEHLCAISEPRFMNLTATFNVRGGLYTKIISEYKQSGFNKDSLPFFPSQNEQ